MSINQPSLSDIWALFQETDRKFKETDLQFKETARRFEETDRKFKETDLQFKETARRFEETDLKFKETARRFEETDLKFKETDLKFKETDLKFQEHERRFQETERIIKESAQQTQKAIEETQREIRAMSKNLGDIGNRLGQFVEHMVMPTVVALFQSRGLDVHEVHPDIEVKRAGSGLQIDLLVVNDGALVVVECKSKMTLEYVDAHIIRMNKFKTMLPAYRNHQAFGAVAALVMPDHVADYAESQGFYVLMQSGETLCVRNEASFLAKTW